MLVDLSDWLTWETLKKLAESNFLTSCVGALAGAWGGAYAVQRIADRTKKRDSLLQELRTCCAAIEIAHSIGSTYLSLKLQHVRALKARYDEQRAEVHAFHEARVAGRLAPGAELRIGLDCELMDPVRTRASYLET